MAHQRRKGRLPAWCSEGQPLLKIWGYLGSQVLLGGVQSSGGVPGERRGPVHQTLLSGARDAKPGWQQTSLCFLRPLEAFRSSVSGAKLWTKHRLKGRWPAQLGSDSGVGAGTLLTHTPPPPFPPYLLDSQLLLPSPSHGLRPPSLSSSSLSGPLFPPPACLLSRIPTHHS